MLNPPRLSSRQQLILIVVVAVLLRAAAAVYLGDTIEALPGTHDQISYDALSRSLLAGEGYRFSENWYPFTPADTPTAHWSFSYPLFLAGTYALAGDHPLVARLIQAIAGGILTIVLIYRIGYRLGERRAAIVGAALAAVYGYFIYYSAALMTETFFIVLVLAAVDVSLALRERPTLAGWIALGAAIGAAALLRQTVLMLLPVILLWLWWERRDRIRSWQFLVPIFVTALFVLPWTIRNARTYDQFLLLNSNAGYALYASNHPRLGSDWQNDDIVVSIPEALEGLNEAEMDRALTREAIGFVLADPGRYLLLTLDKSLEYFKFWPSRDSSMVSNVNRTLSFGLYLPFMLIGIILSLPRWRVYLPIYLLVVTHTAIYLLSWPAPRYRLMGDALLMPVTALAVVELTSRWRIWSQRGVRLSES